MNILDIPESAYIHNNEVSQFTYIQVPMDLIKEECFANVSGNAKLLYGLLLNRTGLSLQNGWIDERGRVYINFSVKELMDEFRISESTAVRLFSELSNIVVIGKKTVKSKNKSEEDKEVDVYFGLIEKVRVLNKSSRIYVHKVSEVKKFIDVLNGKTESDVQYEPVDDILNRKTSGRFVQKLEENISEMAETEVQSDMKVPSGQIWQDGTFKNELTENSDMTSRSGQKRHLDNVRDELAEHSDVTDSTGQNWHEKNNKNNYTYPNNNYPIKSIPRELAEKREEEERKMMDLITVTREIIKDSIDYEYLEEDSRFEKEMLDNLIELMVEACVFPNLVRMDGNIVPQSLVQSRFEKYDYSSMVSVLLKLSNLGLDVHYPKSYYLSVLYNEPLTVHTEYGMRARYDMTHPDANEFRPDRRGTNV